MSGPADVWHELDALLDGDLVLPSDAGFTETARLFNRRFDALRPAAIALPTSSDDVAVCVRFARRHDLPVAVRGGGHSYAGWSSGDGRLVVDLRRLDTVTVEGSGVVVGGGGRLGDVYDTLGEHGRTVASGTCLSVGVAGLALGGGHGLLSRAYGLTCDNVLAATVVTADGVVRRCAAGQEPDLFWALRGAGNGTFGIVTELRLRTQQVLESTSADLVWPWAYAEQVIAAWQDWALDLPDEMWSALRLLRDARGPTLSVVAFSLGDQEALAARLAHLPGDRLRDDVRTEPHLGTIQRFAGKPEAAVCPCYDVRSDFFAQRLSPAAIAAAVAAVESTPVGVEASMAITVLGGAVGRVPVEETTFVHRDQLFLAQYEAGWDPVGHPSGHTGGHPGGADDAEEWLRVVHTAMAPHASGAAYQNVPDPRLPDWRHAYYGSAAPQLERLKQRYDPERLFDFPQAL